MALLDRIFSPTVVAPIEAVGNIVDELFTSDEERLDKELLIQRIHLNAAEIQAKINTIESQHRSIFVAGWRPFLGWICGFSLGWAYLLHPFVSWVCAIWFPFILPPILQIEHLFELVIAMLGLGGLRTFEKMSGRSK